MKQFVFCASKGLLTFQDEEFFHGNAGECGEGGWVGHEGESVPIASELLIGGVCYGIRWVEGSGPRVVFTLK